MIIPEDGCLPSITRKGFGAFNNVMLIKVPKKLQKPEETTYQLATLDSSKKGERWPADEIVDIVMNKSSSNETRSNEKSPLPKLDSFNQVQSRKLGKTGKFKLNNWNSKKNCIQEAGSSVSTMPQNFQDSYREGRRKNLIQYNKRSVQYNERSLADNTHRYPLNRFSNENQLSHEAPKALLNEGTSLNYPGSRYVESGNNEFAFREPLMKFPSYNKGFDSRGPSINTHNPTISPSKSPFNDFQRNTPPYVDTFGADGPEAKFSPEAPNPNFVRVGRSPQGRLIPSATNTHNYTIDNYNEIPPQENFRAFPYNNPNKAECINNNFLEPPYHNKPFNNSRESRPPLLSPPVYNSFNERKSPYDGIQQFNNPRDNLIERPHFSHNQQYHNPRDNLPPRIDNFNERNPNFEHNQQYSHQQPIPPPIDNFDERNPNFEHEQPYSHCPPINNFNERNPNYKHDQQYIHRPPNPPLNDNFNERNLNYDGNQQFSNLPQPPIDNFNERNPGFNSNQRNFHYRRNDRNRSRNERKFKRWGGKAAGKFTKGNNNRK